jgi:hypothetical protein
MGIGGHSFIEMDNGWRKKAMHLKSGDIVKGGFVVICAVRTRLKFSRTLTGIESPHGTLLVTPGHPINVDDTWVPSCIAPGATVVESVPIHGPCKEVYNFVLSEGHFITIAGMRCITLGHGFESPDVLHPYFGTNLVVEDLQRMPGWENGLILLNGMHESIH